jgi:cytochrome c peroxidase
MTIKRRKMMRAATTPLVVASLTAMSLLLWSSDAAALEPIELLGKHIFFDEKLSIPANKQACASCHDPARGWVLPNSAISRSTVVAPGAKPHASGNIKTPTNAYASFSPPFRSASGFGGPPWAGGNFWDGRAEGCGRSSAVPNPSCPVANPAGAVSETVKWSDLPVQFRVEGAAGYVRYLGPTADQALNPFPNDVEQNIREKNVCQQVKSAKYNTLYKQAFGEAINCSTNPNNNPTYRTSFKRLAVALAAWQASDDVNSFSSKRDKALKVDPDGKFPLNGFTDEENRGHDLFYGITSALNSSGKNANCATCHNGVPQGQSADPTGEAPQQLYTNSRYRHIGVPFNREIPGVAKGAKTGLKAHVTNVAPGFFKTTTLRNVAKGLDGDFSKAYAHNGWFKSLESLVHFYNTRDELASCESKGINNATEEEALENVCWPAPEFIDNVAGAGVDNPTPARDLIGDLGLTPEEERAIVAYLKTLNDEYTPTKP